jgi:Domain of unknown function (DUF5666)
MVQSNQQSISGRVALLAVVSALSLLLFWSGRVALAGEANVVGLITAMPTGGLTGNWVVNGITFVASGSTEFRQDKGTLAVGVCAEVEYVGAGQPFTATKIASKNADDCNLSGGTPGASPSPSVTTSATPDGTTTPDASTTPNATPGTEQEAYGLVVLMPASGLVGPWVVGNVTYSAPANAEFKQRNGRLVVGACVKIHYATNTTPFTVRELETEAASACNGSAATPGATPEAAPSKTPSVTPGSESELYGVVQSFPAGLVGNWNIAGMTFAAASGTQFDQERGAFAVGVTVKVHFSVDSAGVNQAREIETKFANDDDGSDDDGNGSFDGADGHAYGAVDSFPAELVGGWRIGGIDYRAGVNTVFAQNNGAFAVGSKVKVEYYLDANNNRIARKIESTLETGGVTQPTSFILFGYVNQLPATDFFGPCVVNNVAFLTNLNTQFNQNNGLLGTGAYVGVEYVAQNGENQVQAVNTYVPPGAGSNNALGTIDNNGGTLTAAGVHATTWSIGGVNYTVTPATDLNDVRSGLEVGQTAFVNSYTAADGSQVATQIRGITIAATIHLPLIRR